MVQQFQLCSTSWPILKVEPACHSIPIGNAWCQVVPFHVNFGVLVLYVLLCLLGSYSIIIGPDYMLESFLRGSCGHGCTWAHLNLSVLYADRPPCFSLGVLVRIKRNNEYLHILLPRVLNMIKARAHKLSCPVGSIVSGNGENVTKNSVPYSFFHERVCDYPIMVFKWLSRKSG